MTAPAPTGDPRAASPTAGVEGATGVADAHDAADGAPVPLYTWCFLGSLVFNLFSGYSDLLGFPIGPDRVLFAAAVGLLVLDRDRPRMLWHRVYAVMIALVLWTSWSALTVGTLQSKDGIFALLDRIVVPFLMFALGPLVFRTYRQRDLLLRTMTIVAIYLGLTSIFEILGPSSLVWPSYIMNPDLGILFGRARGPFLNSEANGMVMGISMFMAMTLWSRVRGLWRVLATVSIVLCVVGLGLCLTRSTWIATIVAGLVVGWLVPTIRRRLPVIVGGTIVGFVLFLLAVPAAAAALDERLNMVSSVYDRQNTNAAGLRIVAAHPIFGVGWHRFIDVGTDWVRQADTYPVTNVTIEIHNVFLSRAAETGIPGSALWILAVLLGPVLAVRRLPRAGDERTWTLILVAALCYWFIPSMTSPNSYPLPNNLMWLIAGFSSARYLTTPYTGPRGGAGEPHPEAPSGPSPKESTHVPA